MQELDLGSHASTLPSKLPVKINPCNGLTVTLLISLLWEELNDV